MAAEDLRWVREENPTWDGDKTRVIGGAPEGAFVLPFQDGDSLPGEWWSAQDGAGQVLGYGRLDTTWGGDAEILLAVDPASQERGIGSYVLAQLEAEAVNRGINYIHNRIREHEKRDFVHDWLVVRGFRGPIDGDLRKRVRAREECPIATAVGTPEAGSGVYDPEADPAGLAPGREDQGGYVDIEQHQY